MFPLGIPGMYFIKVTRILEKCYRVNWLPCYLVTGSCLGNTDRTSVENRDFMGHIPLSLIPLRGPYGSMTRGESERRIPWGVDGSPGGESERRSAGSLFAGQPKAT